MEVKKDEKVIVQSLIGKKQLTFYLRCLQSLLKHSQDDFDLHLHLDGSLSREDVGIILSKLQGTKVNVSDSLENTSRVLDNLEGRPNCQRFRQKSIWAIEFFDPIFAFPDELISFYLDADLLFIRPFSGLFDRDIVKKGAVFLQDTQWDAYCFRPMQLLIGDKKPRAVKGITTGLAFWDKAAIDWDYLEWFLGAHHLHHISEWIMPTAQAGLAVRSEAKTIRTEQITNLYPNAQILNETFGIHLLGSYRKEWVEKIDESKYSRYDHPDTRITRFQECTKQNIFGFTLKQLRRWKNTRLNLW